MSAPILFSRGATLRDVPPEFRGMPLEKYLAGCERLREQFEAYRASLPRPEYLKGDAVLPVELVNTKGREWHKRHVHGSRDDYGWKSL